MTLRHISLHFKEICLKSLHALHSSYVVRQLHRALYFIIFANDLANDLPVTARLFADDCVMYTNAGNSCQQVTLSNTLVKISKWCENWEINLDVDKTVGTVCNT